MSVRRRIKEEARAVYEQSLREEGTLAAYWRGFAAGLGMADRMISQEDMNEQIRTVFTPEQSSKSGEVPS